jgi:hypothetical protein
MATCRSKSELDPVTLHNMALVSMERNPGSQLGSTPAADACSALLVPALLPNIPYACMATCRSESELAPVTLHNMEAAAARVPCLLNKWPVNGSCMLVAPSCSIAPDACSTLLPSGIFLTAVYGVTCGNLQV